MNNYDRVPCSIAIPNQPAELSHQPRVFEDQESPVVHRVPQPPPEQVRAPVVATEAATKKKSCLSTTNSKKEPPAHPALRRKTVAFGRTVNVSQTVEGTSRHSKKALAPSSTASSPSQNSKMAEEQQEDNWRDVMKNEFEVMRKEMQEEATKKQEELNAQNLNKMQEMMSQFFQQITVSKQPAGGESLDNNKENRYERSQPLRQQKPASKIARTREIVKREGVIPPEALTILEQRLRSDPMFRQQIDNVLADAECDANRAAYSPPPPLSPPRYTGGSSGNAALMRETLTVERSIRYDTGLASMDSRQWTTEMNDNRTYDNYRPYEADQPFHSTYQKGQSVSYYPSEALGNAHRNNRVDYQVEELPDYEDNETDVGGRGRARNYHKPVETETAAERERRIREKYARRK